MALTILWAAQAKQDLKDITNYLERRWSKQELQKFFRKLDNHLILISKHPKAFPQTDPQRGVRGSVLTSQVTIFYTIESNINSIRILSLFDTRQDPNSFDLE